ncbi:hypothetical protein AB852_04120 [Streptomyces uncialis]|uniref:Uncharacterized protein n=1 Tax=Streptomyces uncialis TaxID=1048205 RepID=A0A1Q4VDN5_9ACTN|nr:hypothetical protein AB852_04120 [Streptomyces uncialis]
MRAPVLGLVLVLVPVLLMLVLVLLVLGLGGWPAWPRLGQTVLLRQRRNVAARRDGEGSAG